MKKSKKIGSPALIRYTNKDFTFISRGIYLERDDKKILYKETCYPDFAEVVQWPLIVNREEYWITVDEDIVIRAEDIKRIREVGWLSISDAKEVLLRAEGNLDQALKLATLPHWRR